MRTIEVAGTPREMGAAFGEACREPIAELYAARIANAIAQAKSYGGVQIDEAGLVQIAAACRPVVEDFSPKGWAEIEGIAAGANLTAEQIWAMNALTDLRDVAAFADFVKDGPLPEGEGCSSFVVAADRGVEGRALVGQTWDLSTDNLPFVVIVKRRPAEGPSTLALTTVGCLSLIGMNDAGLAVGTTNLRTVDARIGVGYLDIIHAALGDTYLAQAIERIRSAPRAGAHYFYVMDRSQAAAAIECTAARPHVQRVSSGVFVHCNHLLVDEFKPLEAKGTPVASTHRRQSRLEVLLKEGPVGPQDLFRMLADHDGEPDSICRHDFGGITSNASVVMAPGDGAFWAVHGPACRGTWSSYRI